MIVIETIPSSIVIVIMTTFVAVVSYVAGRRLAVILALGSPSSLRGFQPAGRALAEAGQGPSAAGQWHRQCCLGCHCCPRLAPATQCLAQASLHRLLLTVVLSQAGHEQNVLAQWPSLIVVYSCPKPYLWPL